jgi:hypothetical protein
MYYNNTTGCAKVCLIKEPRGKQGPQGEKGDQGDQGPQGEKGDQGDQGPAGTTLNAILFMDDISLTAGSESVLDYNLTESTNNGIIRFTNGTGSGTTFTFSGESITDTSLVEIYAHCDAEAGSAGSDNYLTLELRCIDPLDDTLQTVDIDTRSIQKGSIAHMTFGPSAYRVVEDTTGKNKTIKKTSEYRLYAIVGRNYDLSEIKLIMKLRN